MKKIIVIVIAFGTMTASASSEKVQIEIKADTKELCQLTSDSALKDLESDLRATGAIVKSMSACNKGLDGKFRKTVKFVK